MTESDSGRFLDDPQFQSLLVECLEKLERGEALDRAQLLRHHPEYAAALAEFLADQEALRRIAGEVRNSRSGQRRDQHPAETMDYQRRPHGFAPGERLRYVGEYEILEEIARGGMGIVFKARQQRLNRVVALKMILAGQLAGDEDVKRFRAETEAVAQLDHPNIVPIFEVGEHQGQQYFSMAYVAGPSLEAHLAGGPLPPAEAAGLVEVIAEAMVVAHGKGVIHRDLKPANVLLQREADGRLVPRITDFGLAKRLAVDEKLTVTGQIVGTPSYLPPEQAAGRTAEVTETADVYALGAILYCLLVGRPPFQAATVLQTLQQVLADEPAAPRRINPAIPLDLETICLKCLAKERGQRYESAQALAEDLGRFRRGEPIRARRIGAVERGLKWARRHPARAAVGVLLPLVVLFGSVGVGAAWLWQQAETAKTQLVEEKKHTEEALDREQVAKREAVAALANAQSEHEKAVLAKGEAEKALSREAAARSELAVQKDYVDHLLYARRVSLALAEVRDNEVARARKTLLECDPSRRQWEWRHVWRLCDPSLLKWTPANGRDFRAIACSPDGDHVAIADSTNRLGGQAAITIRSISSGETRTLVSLSSGVIELCYSPDGKLLAAGCSDQHQRLLRVWNVANGREVVAIGGQYHSMSFSPDSKRIAGVNFDSGWARELGVWDARTGGKVFSQKLNPGEMWCLDYDPKSGRLITGESYRGITVWDTDTGVARFSLALPGKGEEAKVATVCVSPDGKHIAAGTFGGRLVIWENVEGAKPRLLGSHEDWVHWVQFSPDGKHLASASTDRQVKVWDVADCKEILSLTGHTRRVGKVCYSLRGQRLVTLSDDKTVRVWNATEPAGGLTLKGHGNWVDGVAFTPDSRRIVSSSSDRTVRVWDAETGAAISVIDDKNVDELWCVAVSPDGRHAAAGTGSSVVHKPGEIVIWDLETKKRVQTLKGHKGAITGICYSPDGQRIASSSRDNTARIWDTVNGDELLAVTPKPGRQVYAVRFSPDGKQIATASPGRVHVWSAANGVLIHEFKGSTIKCLAFSPDGSRLAATNSYLGTDSSIQNQTLIWDVRTGKQLLRFPQSSLAAEAICYSPDGKRIATGDHGKTVKVWDAERGTQLLSLKGHKDEIRSVCFSPDGKRLASSSADHTIRIWNTLDGPPPQK